MGNKIVFLKTIKEVDLVNFNSECRQVVEEVYKQHLNVIVKVKFNPVFDTKRNVIVYTAMVIGYE